MKLYNEKKTINGKTYNTLYVEFDGGFCLPVKPFFELTKNQYRAYMLNLEKLPNYEIDIVQEVNKECDK